MQGVKEQLGGAARVEAEQPESRQMWRPELPTLIRVTVLVYGKSAKDLRKKQRGLENEARAMAMYVCRTLGGYKLTEIGQALGLEKYSSVSSGCVAMQRRVEQQKPVARRARQIARLVSDSYNSQR